jgi:hypothetical protein
MLIKTNFTVPIEFIDRAIHSLPKSDSKVVLNQPKGDFFYDEWEIKHQYKNTIWETLLNKLPKNIGEARVIILQSKTSYTAHADIDDRYHLNLQGENSYLLNLDDKIMYETNPNGIWYDMNAGKLHSATNLSGFDRIQLVVRKLLNRNTLKNPIAVTVSAVTQFDENNRYIFDQCASKWLNRANKEGTISNFKYSNENEISFNIEESELSNFQIILPKEFKIIA